MNLHVEVEAGGLNRHLERLQKNLSPEGIDKLIRALAFWIEGEAKRRAPVDTGSLRASIRATRHRAGEWWVSVGALYGALVELGTRRMRAQPYMGPAAHSAEKEAARLGEALLEGKQF